MKIIECVPNFSEGKDSQKLEAIAQAIFAISGVKLLDTHKDPDHNRSVFTFIGTPGAIFEAAMAVCGKAVEFIDMRTHTGIHPRIGAVDVVPFIPLGDAEMQDAVAVAQRFGRAFSEQYRVPVYFYGEAAMKPERKELPEVRKGGYEGFSKRLSDPLWAPCAGPCFFNEKSGATAVGARSPLIAFNINLSTSDVGVAKDIARAIRQSSGGLPCVKAMGVYLKSRDIAQVTMNLTNYQITPIRMVYDRVQKLAKQHHVNILESELVGLIPRKAMQGVTDKDLKLANFSEKKILESYF
jgi:glutamate formiminotransferase